MNKRFLLIKFASIALTFSGGLLVTDVYAATDNTQTLPDAKPGECYAKVVVPATFETRTDNLVVQEAGERLETIAAKYQNADQTIVVKESGRKISVIPAIYEDGFEKVEIRPAENNWTVSMAGKTMPASPGALDGISRSGVDLAGVTAGACFREYHTQAEYKTENRQVLVKEGGETISVTPAVYETVEERIVIKEASTRTVDVPASYRTETESVLVEPARSVWKKGRGPIERIDNTTGEIMCLIEVPARYETITKTVMDKPASTKIVDVPAEYKDIKVQRIAKPATESRTVIEAEYATVTTRVKVADAGFFWLKKGEAANQNANYSGREVCLTARPAEFRTIAKKMIKTAAQTRVAEIPARYQTVKVQRLLTPPSDRRIVIPERIKTVTRQVQTSPSRLEWRPVLCETNMTPKLITSIQRALKREGYDPGPIDGVVGSTTLDAISKFQIKNNLDRGGLTYQTMKALKVQS